MKVDESYGKYVLGAKLSLRQERGLEAASWPALSQRPGISQGPWDCSTRKRRERRAPFAGATVMLTKYSGRAGGFPGR